MKKRLFVGGCADGKMLECDTDMFIMPKITNELAQNLPEDPMPGEPIIEGDRYRKMVISIFPDKVCLMRLVTMTEMDVIVNMMMRYAQSKNEQ